MRRPVCPQGQIDIFPPEVMQEFYGHAEKKPPNLALPFPRTADVSLDRVAEILSTSERTVRRLRERGFLSGYSIGASTSKSLRIEYASLVAYCDDLRLQAGVPVRNPPAKGLRVNPRELLPFPMADTVTLDFVSEKLDCGRTLVSELIEAGKISGYRLLKESSSHMRIDVRSLERYMESLRTQASVTAYRVAAMRR